MIELNKLDKVNKNYSYTIHSLQCFRFPGIRYAFPGLETGPDMVLIFDVNGYIAGMHSVVLERISPGDWQSGSIW